MSPTAAHALLRRLQATFQAHMGEVKYYDVEHGRELWMLTANGADGQRWTSRAESYDEAVRRLAGLMGFEVEDG